jgi:Leucine-rich repeat (LRR) protein
MKKIWSLLLLLVLIGSAFLNSSCNCGSANETRTVNFTDKNLYTEIRRNLGKSAGEEVTKNELLNLTTLWFATNSDIIDLHGIEYCTNMVELDFSNNQISNIFPLASLTNLSHLNISSNRISDISPLSSLNLYYLYLDRNEITDIAPISSQSNLLILTLSENKIIDISTLSSLTTLNELDLGGNQIGDISSLKTLNNLDWLYLDRNEISDISPLVANSGLSEGDLVLLEDNNLDLSEGSEDMENIRALEDKGVKVIY